MIDIIQRLNSFNIDAFKRGTRYITIWPGGDIAVLSADDLKNLAKWIYLQARWKGRDLKQLQEDFFKNNRNDLIRTIY